MQRRETRRIEQRGVRIAKAVEDRERITFEYHGARREVSAFELRPERIGYRSRPGDTTRGMDVVGWDHQRDGFRTFKLSDVRHVARTGLPAREPV